MAPDPQIANKIADLLGEMKSACDSGFALAAHVRYTRPTLLYQTYSQDWADHYSEKGFMLSDPTVHWGLSNVGAVDWDALSGQDPEGVIAAARSYGLTNGWTYSVGAATSRSLASMTSSAGFSDAQRGRIRAIIDEVHALTDSFDTFTPAQQDKLRHLI
jgi:LuxR family transcriptional regulator